MTTTNNAPISFRLTDDELELLRQHQEDGEKSLNLTAKRLLLNALGVDAKKSSLQFVNTVDSNQIKELIETAVQEKLEKLTIVDNVDTIKNLIAESLADGDIKDAISTSYEAMMGQFNGLLEELQETQKQLQELKSNPPAAPVPSPQLPINNEDGELDKIGDRLLNLVNSFPQSPITKAEDENSLISTADPSPVPNDQEFILNLLPIGDILGGKEYTGETLINQEIDVKITKHKEAIESRLKITLGKNLTSNYINREFRKILEALNYTIEHKQIKKKETYWILNP